MDLPFKRNINFPSIRAFKSFTVVPQDQDNSCAINRRASPTFEKVDQPQTHQNREKTYLLELIKFARDINFDETYFSDGMTEDEIVGSVIKLERKIEECK